MANDITVGDTRVANHEEDCNKMETAQDKNTFKVVLFLSEQSSPEPTANEMTVNSTEDSIAVTTNEASFEGNRLMRGDISAQSTVTAGLESMTNSQSEHEHGHDAIAEKILVSRKQEDAEETDPGIPADTGVPADGQNDHIGSEEISIDLGSQSKTHGAADHTICPFLDVYVDIRCLIYQLFAPLVNKTIHLTYSPETTIFQDSWPARYKLSENISNLLVCCRQVYEELTGLLYGANTFVFMPGQQNYNSARMPDPCSMTNVWFPRLPFNIRQQTRKMRLFLDFSLHADLEHIAELLADFPDVEITVQAPSAFRLPIRQIQSATLKRTCRAICDARTNAYRTAWHDAGSTDVARMLEDSLPAGFQTLQSSQHHIQASMAV